MSQWVFVLVKLWSSEIQALFFRCQKSKCSKFRGQKHLYWVSGSWIVSACQIIGFCDLGSKIYILGTPGSKFKWSSVLDFESTSKGRKPLDYLPSAGFHWWAYQVVNNIFCTWLASLIIFLNFRQVRSKISEVVSSAAYIALIRNILFLPVLASTGVVSKKRQHTGNSPVLLSAEGIF